MRRCSRRSLPDELMAENILSRQPTKSILRCRCVCKLWRSLITTSRFVSTHLIRNNNTKKEEENRFIFIVKGLSFDDQSSRAQIFLFKNLTEDYFLTPMSLNLPPGLNENKTALFVVGSVKGLICRSIGQKSQCHILKLILFNPSIGHFQFIPPPVPHSPPENPLYTWAVEGFGFDETTQDYKILLIPSGIYSDPPPSTFVANRPAFVYSLNSNSWRSLVISPAPFHCMFRGIFIYGGIHWIGYHQQHSPSAAPIACICVFDIKAETFRQILLPQCLQSLQDVFRPLKLMEFGGEEDSSSLAIADYTHIWLMKEYALGDESSRIKLATLGDSVASVDGFIDNDHLLIQLYQMRKLKDPSGCLVSHNIKEKLNNRLIYPVYSNTPGTSFSRLFKYVPSLALLDKPNNIDATFVHATPSPPTTNDEIVQSHQVELQLRRSKRTRKSPAA